MSRKLGVAALLLSLICVTSGRASEPRQDAWIKAKCALCHGVDGAGNTPEGKRLKVPDMRSAEVQKHTDAELTRIITEGHSHMPSFRVQLKAEHVQLLVQYIRSIAAKTK